MVIYCFNFDIFWVHIFHFVCVTNAKVHYESTIFFKFNHLENMIIIKIYCNMDYFSNDNIKVEYGFRF
jgi:hypothetical protein